MVLISNKGDIMKGMKKVEPLEFFKQLKQVDKTWSMNVIPITTELSLPHSIATIGRETHFISKNKGLIGMIIDLHSRKSFLVKKKTYKRNLGTTTKKRGL